MKNNFIIKLSYILSMLIGVQFAYADKLSFQFIHTGDISSVFFDHTPSKTNHYASYETAANDGQLSISTTDPKQSPYKVTVNTNITKTGSTTIANLFNQNLGYTTQNNNTSHMVGLSGTYNSHAANLDFRLTGTLYIESEPVTSEFYLAHTNYNHGSPNWWIGTLGGTKPTGLSHAALTVKTASGKSYCLSQNGSNYQVNVIAGACTSYTYDWTNAKSVTLSLKKGDNVSTILFIYNNYSDAIHNGYDYLQSVIGNATQSGYDVTVTAQLENSTHIATSFINKFNHPYSKYNILKSGYQRVMGEPDYLNLWVEGSLYVNGVLLASDFTIAQYGSDKWWIGSKHGQTFKDTDGYIKMNLLGFCIGPDGGDSKFKIFYGSCKGTNGFPVPAA